MESLNADELNLHLDEKEMFEEIIDPMIPITVSTNSPSTLRNVTIENDITGSTTYNALEINFMLSKFPAAPSFKYNQDHQQSKSSYTSLNLSAISFKSVSTNFSSWKSKLTDRWYSRK